jgi:hypothetical protein
MLKKQKRTTCQKRRVDHAVVSFFAGVADFLGAAFFVAGFFAAAFLAAGALVFVTRPDLVFPVTTAGFSSTAGAWETCQ